MQLLAVFLAFYAVPLVTEEKPAPELVKVYCFSEDLEAGFKDKVAAYACKELGSRGKDKKSLTLVQSREAAIVVVEFLGVEDFSARGETTHLLGGYAWTPDQMKSGARMTVAVGDHIKGFYAEGLNDQATVGVTFQAEAWIRENRETILAKAAGR